jgi:lysophospholipase L1-like esterase
MGARRWQRYVAIGDSTTEGLDDPGEYGGFRGWADRLAEHIAKAQSGLDYANLAIRGRTTAQIRDEQVDAALALEPDLVTVVAGMNDVLRPTFDPDHICGQIEDMFQRFTRAGATVLSFTLPDPTPNLPFTEWLQPRVAALNAALTAAAERSGIVMVDVATYADASDPRLWSTDRLHGNSDGHARVAHALAWGLGVDGFDDSWLERLPPAIPAPRREAVRADVAWLHEYALPWLWRTVTGRSAGDGLSPKRPTPIPILAEVA